MAKEKQEIEWGVQPQEPGGNHYTPQPPQPGSLAQAQVTPEGYIAGKYRSFRAQLGDRPSIVWGLGAMGFKRTVKKPVVAILLVITWLFTIMMTIILAAMPSIDTTSEEESTPEDIQFFAFDLEKNMLFYQIMTPFAIIFTAVSAGVYISSDMSDKSIYLYLVRPIRRADYMASRLISAVLLLTIVVILPNLILWILLMGASGADTQFFLSKLWTFGALFLHGLLYCLTFALVGLTFSASTKRRHWSLVGILVAFSTSLTMAETFAAESRNDNFYLFSIMRNLDVIGAKMVGESSSVNVNWGAALGVVALVCAASVWFILHRLQNVEDQL